MNVPPARTTLPGSDSTAHACDTAGCGMPRPTKLIYAKGANSVQSASAPNAMNFVTTKESSGGKMADRSQRSALSHFLFAARRLQGAAVIRDGESRTSDSAGIRMETQIELALPIVESSSMADAPLTRPSLLLRIRDVEDQEAWR